MSIKKTALIQFLSNWPQLNSAAISAISLEFQFKKLTKGELLLQAGKVADEYLFLERGFIRSYLFDTEGNEITMNFYSQNEVVFEVASFFQRSPSQEYFEATEDCTGWVLTYEKLNYLFHTLPEFRDFGRAILVKGFISFKLRTLAMINKTAEERYELLLKSNPTIFQHASLKHIASYLGITDTSLSRIRKLLAGK
jgi:CRP-like cAMP-binding protein